ncbi:hypothetical protein BJ741DRAFT_137338 [Chytriomyces cf. hyalinus JEL632]|nr:hypothetical protein BJ741DRAFT_137338 [Chytriomyces cf. hyalinus JEL632]
MNETRDMNERYSGYSANSVRTGAPMHEDCPTRFEAAEELPAHTATDACGFVRMDGRHADGKLTPPPLVTSHNQLRVSVLCGPFELCDTSPYQLDSWYPRGRRMRFAIFEDSAQRRNSSAWMLPSSPFAIKLKQITAVLVNGNRSIFRTDHIPRGPWHS